MNQLHGFQGFVTSVVFNNKIWVIGGQELHDVWYSTDGIIWICASQSTEWEGRGEHTSVVFNDKVWVIGVEFDLYELGLFNDAWYSTNGDSWTMTSSAADWAPRCSHTPLVYDNKFWVIGGLTFGNLLNDVWYSNDGVNWIKVLASEIWSGRSNHTSVVFDNKIWVLGGDNKKDVWYGEIVRGKR